MVRQMTSDWLEPRMSLGCHRALLRNLAFEQVRLRAVRREGAIPVTHSRAGSSELTERVVRHNGHEARRFAAVGHSEEGYNPSIPRHRGEHRLPKSLDRLERYR